MEKEPAGDVPLADIEAYSKMYSETVLVDGESQKLEFGYPISLRLERLCGIRDYQNPNAEKMTTQQLLQEYVNQHGFSPDAAEQLVAEAPELKELKSVCGECKKVYNTVPTPDGMGGISHGLCAECRAKIMQELAEIKGS